MLNLLTIAATLLLGSVSVQGVIPDNDPFYQPPSGYESSAPGTVFKNRAAASGISGVTATQLLYRTSDALGGPAVTVATVLVGTSSSKSKLVAFSTPEDAANSTCAPSYGFTSNSSSLGDDITNGLANGWTIVIPDYEGFKSAFSVGHLEGYQVLDSLRAAKSYAPLGISASAALGGYGYSGGAIATGWAAALHPSYAGELNVVGWAFGGTPANVTSTLVNVDGTLYAGFAVAGVAGQIAAYPDAQTRFTQIATTTGKAAILKSQSQCSSADITSFLFQKVQSTQYQSLGANFLKDPVISSIVAKSIMGTNVIETPKAPIYMYHGQSDQVIPYASAKAAATAWCANGAKITFVTETGGTGHVGTASVLGKSATDWLALRLNGTPPAAGCSYSSVSTGGLPLRRRSVSPFLQGNTALERFGKADSKVEAKLLALHAAGQPVAPFWQSLWR